MFTPATTLPAKSAIPSVEGAPRRSAELAVDVLAAGEGVAIRHTVYYRCEFKEQEQSLLPGLDHPRTVCLREDEVCRALDRWIAKAFAPDRLTAPLTALAHASAAANAAANAAETLTPEQAEARKTVKERERQSAFEPIV